VVGCQACTRGGCAEAEEFINRVFENMPLQMQLYVKCGMEWAPEAYTGFRRRVADYILSLTEALGE